MGTISEKLTYLNETKELIQEKIQDLGGIINNNSTFREYADILADVYNKYPKDSYSGTSIEIENSKKSKIEILINGNSNQNATPSPSNKVNISNSCGNNKINITKKNLLSLEDIPESTVKDVTYSCSNQTLHLNGTASGGMQIDFINVGVPAGTYHFSSGVTNPNGSGNYARYLMNSAGTSLKTNGGEVTLSEQTDVHFRFYANSGSVFDDATV